MLPSWERKITWSVPFTLWVRFANFVSLVCGVQSSLWPLRLFYSLYWIIFIPWSKILLLFSHPVMSICNIMDCSMLGFPILLHLPEFAQLMSIELVMPSNISSFVVPFFSWLQSFPESGSFLISQLFASGRHSIGTSPSASVLPMNIQDWLVWSCRPRDSQESSPTPLFKSINSLTLSLLYGPTLTAIHDYWKNHSFDYTELCRQSNVSAF